ncbi:MAG: hypothetical protein WD081_06075 [Gammaproteobacteria bacterium]
MRIVVLTLVLLATAPVSATAVVGLEEIITLARGGAQGLALRLLDQYQSDPKLDRIDWAAAERERAHILAARGDWRTLADRFATLDSTLPEPFLDWTRERRAEALLNLGDGAGARAALRQLIWRADVEGDALRHWRALVVRSYLVDEDLDAALVSLQRYAFDHGADGPALRLMHGEALLAASRPDEAYAVLRAADNEPLQWLAALRAGALAPGAVFERAVRAGSVRDAQAAHRHAAWRVAAEAARRMNNAQASVAALERALVSGDGSLNLPTVLRVHPDELWLAYTDWGAALGNGARLLVGVDQGWLDAAERADPPQARALYAALAGSTRQASVVEYAHYRFARSIRAEPLGDRLLAALYLDAGAFSEPEHIPAMVRYLLVDGLLRDGDVVLASRLIADLAEPPAAADPVDWNLRRARVLVLAGRPDDGSAVLESLLAAAPEFDVDKVMQVLFDLQASDAHSRALPLFERVYAREDLDLQRRREILFWMADSRRALDEALEAARLYLLSAGLADPYALDQWAQTARFQAAEALADAGLTADAAALYRTLLNATDDPGRRAVLQHRLDQLARTGPPPV